MNRTGTKQNESISGSTVTSRLTKENISRAKQVVDVASSIAIYAEAYALSTEITLEMPKHTGKRQTHSTDNFFGWKLNAEGRNPNSEPNCREAVALLLKRGVQFFVYREPLDKEVPLYKPEGFNLVDLAIDTPILQQNEARIASENQAMIDRMVYGGYLGYDAVMESLLDFADQHEIIVPQFEQPIVSYE